MDCLSHQILTEFLWYRLVGCKSRNKPERFSFQKDNASDGFANQASGGIGSSAASFGTIEMDGNPSTGQQWATLDGNNDASPQNMGNVVPANSMTMSLDDVPDGDGDINVTGTQM